MRPPDTAMSIPSPLECSSDAVCTQASTSAGALTSTRGGHSCPGPYGVRGPHGSAIRSCTEGPVTQKVQLYTSPVSDGRAAVENEPAALPNPLFLRELPLGDGGEPGQQPGRDELLDAGRGVVQAVAADAQAVDAPGELPVRADDRIDVEDRDLARMPGGLRTQQGVPGVHPRRLVLRVEAAVRSLGPVRVRSGEQDDRGPPGTGDRDRPLQLRAQVRVV